MSAAQPGAPGSRVLDLSQVSLPRLLFSLLRQRFTGTVVVPQQTPYPGNRTIWFRGGMAVFTDWSEPTEVLGQVLIGQQLIAEDALLAALETMANSGGLLGQTLLAMGRLSSEQLAEGLRRQCSRKVARLSGLDNGQAVVTPVEHSVGTTDGMVPINALEVIHSAVSLHYDEARVAAEMGAAARAVVQATPALNKYVTHFRFRSNDKAALQALVRGGQLSSIGALPDVTPKRAAQLVYLLWACQMLTVGATPAAAPERYTPTGDTAPPPGFEPTSHRPNAGTAAPDPAYTATPQTPTPPPPRPATPPRPASTTPVPPRPASQAATPKPTPRPAAAPKPAAPRPASRPAASKPAAPKPAAPKAEAPAKPRPAPIEIDGVDPAFAEELISLEEKIADETHAFDLFGLELTATRKDVRRAWGDLSRKFHPDALASQGLEALRERVSEAFAALSEAHQLLADAEARTKLAEQIEAGEFGSTTSDATATARAAFEAELMVREGEKLMRSNNFARALEQFAAAAAIYSEPATEACIAWCTYQTSEKRRDDATLANVTLEKIVTEFPNIPQPHYFNGMVLMALQSDDKAVEAFAEAYRLDPRLIDAERQARALRLKKKNARKAAAEPPPRKGLRGLFGKK
ncbi:MAG: DUF4388 domain-containing protein [Myxococcota bacterium]